MARFTKIVLFAALLVISISMPARDLPSLPAEKNIRTGTLENGIQYYLAATSAKKGFAEIALVRKGEIPTEATRMQMRRLSGFSGTSPESFLIRNGIGAGREGYFLDWDGSTVFRFPDVPLYNRQVTDSTLLMTFALVAASPAPQAVVIAGDISPDDMLRRMSLFSMLVPYAQRDAAEEEYVWEPYLSPSFSLQTLRDTDEALVSVTYFAPRTPKRYLPTSQTLVMNIFAKEFEVIIRDRLRRTLREKEIPYSTIDIDYLRSTETSGDVKYTISVGTDKEHIDAAMEAVSLTVSSLATFGVIKEDFDDARQVLTPSMRRHSRSVPSHASYVNRCIRSYLYGSSLASRGEEYRLFGRAPVTDSSGVAFFNRMSASFLNPSCNADIRYEAPLDTLDDLEAFFRYNLNYLKGSAMTPGTAYLGDRGDSLGLVSKAPRVKVKKEGVDPVTGGAMWTWSNGFRVIFHPVKDAPALEYVFVFDGGYAGAQSLQSGEAGYFTDILSLYNIGGIRCDDFYSMLAANGIELKGEVHPASTILRGTVLPSRLPLLMRSVLSLLDDSTPNPDRFREYCQGERLRLSARRAAPYRIDGALYGAIHPDYSCTPYKDPSLLRPELLDKADRLLRGTVFPGASRGVLVISGNIDPLDLRKVLSGYLGGFHTAVPASVGRSVKFPVSEGRKSLSGADLPGRVALLSECDFPLTGTTYYLAQAAGEAARRLAVQAAGSRARDLRAECSFVSWPQERLTLRITFDRADGETKEIIDDILKAFADKRSVSAADAEAYKAMVLSAAEDTFKTPEGLNALTVARYAQGKDFKTRYKENIQSITRDDISAALSALCAGSWAIYSGYGQ